jgi:hypothetical protein
VPVTTREVTHGHAMCHDVGNVGLHTLDCVHFLHWIFYSVGYFVKSDAWIDIIWKCGSHHCELFLVATKELLIGESLSGSIVYVIGLPRRFHFIVLVFCSCLSVTLICSTTPSFQRQVPCICHLTFSVFNW